MGPPVLRFSHSGSAERISAALVAALLAFAIPILGLRGGCWARIHIALTKVEKHLL